MICNEDLQECDKCPRNNTCIIGKISLNHVESIEVI